MFVDNPGSRHTGPCCHAVLCHCAGAAQHTALAAALHQLAHHCATAPQALRRDLRLRLLSLFSDLGMRGGTPAVRAAMGALMPAIAAAFGTKDARLGLSASISRFSFNDIAKTQKEDGNLVKVGRGSGCCGCGYGCGCGDGLVVVDLWLWTYGYGLILMVVGVWLWTYGCGLMVVVELV